MSKVFKPICLTVALALVLSLGALVLPLGIALANSDTLIDFATGDTGTAEWSTQYPLLGSYSVELVGGTEQTGDDYAAVVIPMDGTMLLSDVTTFVYNYTFATAGNWGPHMCFYTHDPADDETGEISLYSGGSGPPPGTPAAQGLNTVTITDATDGFFWYGSESGSALTEGLPNMYTLAAFQADAAFSTHVIDRIQVEYGWWGSGDASEPAYVDELVLNGDTYDLEPLEAVIIADPEEGTAPLTVEFDAGDSIGDITDYEWDFGDGETDTGEVTEHTFNEMGVYTVTLTVTEQLGGTDTAEVDITVNGVADFTAEPKMGETPLTVQFRDRSIGATEWRWSFGDGESSNSRSPSHTYQNEGIYTVSLTVNGPDTDTIEEVTAHEVKQDYIVVEDSAFPASLRVSDLKVTPTYAQPGQAVYITATVTNDGGSWGSNEMQLLINGQSEQSAPVGMAPGTSQTIDFTVYKTQAREYQVTIGNATATFFVMEEAAQPTQRAGLLAGGTLDTGGIIAIIAIGVILVGGVVVIFLFSRRSS